MQRYSDPAEAIHVSREESFTIELPGNPTTGYTWQAEVEAETVELIGQEFEPAGKGAGSAGMEVCQFRAVNAGETDVNLAYRRPWSGETRETRRFRVVVS
jgi:inhibitor of cysteine peptidase